MQRLYVHPLPVRIWHWINAAGFLLLIATGVQIRYQDLFSVISFKNAVEWHNWIGFVLIGNYFIWFIYYLTSDRRKVYLAERNPKQYFLDAARQIKFYAWGIFVGDPNPHKITVYRKFNALQIMMYQMIMGLLVPLLFISGILLWDLERFGGIVEMLGGVRIVDTVHVLLFIFFSSFIISHVYLVTLGHTTMAHIRAMFDGHEEVADDPAPSRSDA